MTAANQRVVLITGATAGIAQACAQRLHRRGYRVYGTSRNVAEQNVSNASSGFQVIKMDVDVDSSVKRGIEWVSEREGRLDVLVNKAGFGVVGPVEDTSIANANWKNYREPVAAVALYHRSRVPARGGYAAQGGARLAV